VANLSKPGIDPVYSYSTYDPTPHYPNGFGEGTSAPIAMTETLPPYGLRYIDAAAINAGSIGPARGVLHTAGSSAWIASSIFQSGPDAVEVQRWYEFNTGSLRDCAVGHPWIVIGPAVAEGFYSLQWQTFSPETHPTVTYRYPTGTDVSPYDTRIRISFANVDPDSPIDATIVSSARGPLNRDLRVERSGLQGQCAETVSVVDYSIDPLPPADAITITIGDIVSPFGNTLLGETATWQFSTQGADTESPLITLGILPNSVLLERITIIVFSDEKLYPDTGGPVRVVINNEIAIDLTSQDQHGLQWRGEIALTETGVYDFRVRAIDLAGNAVADEFATYAVTIEDDGSYARIGSIKKVLSR